MPSPTNANRVHNTAQTIASMNNTGCHGTDWKFSSNPAALNPISADMLRRAQDRNAPSGQQGRSVNY